MPALLSVIAEQQLLLVIDNFEQIMAAAPVVAALSSAPRLTVLVTSRESLKLAGEQEYPIAPLVVVPGTAHGSEPPPESLPAVQLFIERAKAVHPTFAASGDNLDAIVEICRRLDGLPLAIELAAARVKAFPPATLLARLDRRLPLLTGSRRDAPQRQQTMRDAIAWSHEQLTPSEQQVFRRLGIFVGGFILEAAEEVAGGGADILRDLESLVDKSLVRLETSIADGSRYRMLETIREFALERLIATTSTRPSAPPTPPGVPPSARRGGTTAIPGICQKWPDEPNRRWQWSMTMSVPLSSGSTRPATSPVLPA